MPNDATPRTDSLEVEVGAFKDHVQATAAFSLARQLERELIAARAELAAVLIACARVFQSQAEYDHAQHCLESASDLYAMT